MCPEQVSLLFFLPKMHDLTSPIHTVTEYPMKKTLEAVSSVSQRPLLSSFPFQPDDKMIYSGISLTRPASMAQSSDLLPAFCTCLAVKRNATVKVEIHRRLPLKAASPRGEVEDIDESCGRFEARRILAPNRAGEEVRIVGSSSFTGAPDM